MHGHFFASPDAAATWRAEHPDGAVVSRADAFRYATVVEEFLTPGALREGGIRTTMSAIKIVDYDPAWPRSSAGLTGALRAALGTVAVRIDHIGSTAVPGLAAKPIIDVQVSVEDFEPLDAYRIPLADLGFVHRADNTERTERYFREAPGSGRDRTHIHVRRVGGFSEQFPLLFREYLRAHPIDAEHYATVKRRLAAESGGDRHGYTEAKVPYIWQIIRRADDWAQKVGWTPPASDA